MLQNLCDPLIHLRTYSSLRNNSWKELYLLPKNMFRHWWSLLNRVSCVPYVPAWCACQRAKDVPIFQLCEPKCQGLAIFQVGLPTWQKACHFFQLRLLKGVPTFQLFFKRIMFFYIQNICIPDMFYIFCIF